MNSEGTTLAIAGSLTDSEPGTELLRSIDFNSDGRSAVIEVTHPLIRSRSKNLRLSGLFEIADYESDFGALRNTNDQLSVLRAGAAFDLRDRFNGTTLITARASKGLDLFNATVEGDAFKSRANGSGVFFSFAADVSRTQPVLDNFEVFAAAGGQVASRALLAPEECGYGGGAFGRGFDNFELSGENCLYGLVEARYAAPQFLPKTAVQPYVFYDAGSVWQKDLLPGEPRRSTGQSVGAGFRFAFRDRFSGGFEYAKPLTRPVALEGDDDGRFFFSLSFAL